MENTAVLKRHKKGFWISCVIVILIISFVLYYFVNKDDSPIDVFIPSKEVGKTTLISQEALVNIQGQIGAFQVSVESIDMFDVEVQEDYDFHQMYGKRATLVAIKVSVENTSDEKADFNTESFVVTNTGNQFQSDSYLEEDEKLSLKIPSKEKKEAYIPFLIDAHPSELTRLSLKLTEDFDDYITIDFDINNGEQLEKIADVENYSDERISPERITSLVDPYTLIDEKKVDLKQHSDPFTVSINNIAIYKMEPKNKFKDSRPSFTGNKYLSFLVVDTTVENSGDVDSVFPVFFPTAKVITNTHEQTNAEIFFSFADNVFAHSKSNFKVCYYLKTKPEDLETLKFYFDVPSVLDRDEFVDTISLETDIKFKAVQMEGSLDDSMNLSSIVGTPKTVLEDYPIQIEKESGPLKMTLEKLDLIEVEQAKDGILGEGETTIARIKYSIENKSTDRLNFFVTDGSVQINQEDIIPLGEEDMLFNPFQPSTFFENVVYEDYIFIVIKQSPEDISNLKISIEPPTDSNYNTVGDPLEFDFDISN